jgi:hypothetical protein
MPAPRSGAHAGAAGREEAEVITGAVTFGPEVLGHAAGDVGPEQPRLDGTMVG